MLYRIDLKAGSAKLYREPYSGSKLPYRTVKEMRKLYPDEDFNIIGEIGGLSHAPDKGDALLADDGRKIPIHPRGSMIRPLEWVAGYAAVGKNNYLAVIKSLARWLNYGQRKGLKHFAKSIKRK